MVSGAAIECTLLTDGRRQIIDFLLPGDYCGFILRDNHMFGVEAVKDGTKVACYPRGEIGMLTDNYPKFEQALHEMALDSVRCLRARLLVLGKMTALERVASFVIEMAQRAPGGRSGEFDLVMSRYDIADYLAISPETVSRTITDLKAHGAINLLGSHHVRIVNCSLLEATSSPEL